MMLERWAESLGLPSPFSFRSLMSTESQLLVWKGEGLPTDDLSQASLQLGGRGAGGEGCSRCTRKHHCAIVHISLLVNAVVGKRLALEHAWNVRPPFDRQCSSRHRRSVGSAGVGTAAGRTTRVVPWLANPQNTMRIPYCTFTVI